VIVPKKDAINEAKKELQKEKEKKAKMTGLLHLVHRV
jgi:hypothetical protein